MNEIISINIGQAGLQIGESFWHLIQQEHRLNDPDSPPIYQPSQSLLYETNRRMVPRQIMIDLEPSVGDQIRRGRLKNLFHPDTIITSKEDASSLFSRGYQLGHSEFLSDSLDNIRKQIEQCDSLQGFFLTFSVGGGTGSGFTSHLMKNLKNYYPKQVFKAFCVFPSLHRYSNILEPYNFILSFELLNKYLDLVTVFDNRSLYRNSDQFFEHQNTNFSEINQMIAQVISSVSVSTRFNRSRLLNLNQLQINTVPYKRLHFLSPSYVHCDPLYAGISSLADSQITNSLLAKETFFNSVQLDMGKLMACSIVFRGGFSDCEVRAHLAHLQQKRSARIVSWCPNAFHVNVNARPNLFVKSKVVSEMGQSVCSLANVSGLKKFLGVVGNDFDRLFSRRSFVHWYLGEGGYEDDFYCGREDFAFLEKDLEEAEKD